jgi:hypothetical protein
MAVLSRSDLGILSFLANSDFVAISREYLYANHLGDVSQMVRDEVVRIKEDGVAVMVNKCTWLLLEKIITRYNSRLMSLSKTKATRRSPCYGEERLFLAFLGCWLGRLFRTCFTILLLFDCKIFSVISGGFVQVRCIASPHTFRTALLYGHRTNPM